MNKASETLKAKDSNAFKQLVVLAIIEKNKFIY
jgi:hypothetical protein